jgi:hypothetical protein
MINDEGGRVFSAILSKSKSDRKGRMISFALFLIIIIFFIVSLVPTTSTVRNPSHEIISRGSIWTGPYVIVEVSPPGYPVIGQSWIIRVYLANLTGEGDIVFQSYSNVTVFVFALVDGKNRNYELNVDANGETMFQFNAGCTDIAFQAVSSEFSPSSRVVITSHYVPASAIDTLLSFNAFSALGLLAADFAVFERKNWKSRRMGILWKFWMASIVFLFSFVFFVSLYAKLFLGTLWGYPENIIGGFVTVGLLNYVFYLGVILLFVFVLYTLAIRGKADADQGALLD